MATDAARVGLLIPAHRPPATLVALVDALAKRQIFAAITVVDDGSGPDFSATFAALAAIPRVEVLAHGVNLGKGAALRTGLNAFATRHPELAGVITADADGQHATDDILNVARDFGANPQALVLGVRSFSDRVPLRSRIGNAATRLVFRVLVGRPLADTQTGLRGIPLALVPQLLRLPSQRYEFEMDMLIAAARSGVPFRELPIRTIYIDDNKESHFQPFYDSFRIYFLLLRFTLASLVSTLADVMVFLVVLPLAGSLAGAHVAARVVSGSLNFVLMSAYVFRSGRDWPLHLMKFAVWVVLLGSLSFWLQTTMQEAMAWPAIAVKMTVESALFVVNFLVQRDVIFLPSGSSRS